MASVIEISVPDALVRALGGTASDLPRRTLEAAAAQKYATGTITHAEVADILALSRWETDAFLKSQNAFAPGESEEFADDLERLRKITAK